MSGEPVWSWADVPGLDSVPAPPRRRGPRAVRPRGHHPVALGHLDSKILPMAGRGDTVVRIAATLGCSEGVVERRLRAIGRRGNGR